MKKTVKFIIAFLFIITLVGCGGNNHEGEAKTPSGSSVQKGRDYEEVIDKFEEQGFTNVKTAILDDLITGWLIKDGEVESVSVDGDEDYSSDTWYPNNVEVIVTYHTFREKETKEKSHKTGGYRVKTPRSAGAVLFGYTGAGFLGKISPMSLVETKCTIFPSSREKI